MSEPTQSVTASDVSKPQVPEDGGRELLNAETATTSVAKDTPQVSLSEDRNSVLNSQENEQKSGEIGNTGVNESVPDNEEIGSASQVDNEVDLVKEPRVEEEILDNGDKRITNFNSRGEVATVLPLDTDNPAFETATKNTIEAVKKAGVEVTPEMVQAVNEFAEMQKRTAPETVSVQDEHLQTVVSSADGAKVLKDLDSAIAEYENDTQTKEKTFLGNLAKVLGAKKHGSNSQYATFEAVNGGKLSIALKLDANGNVVEVSNVSSVHSRDGVKELERLSFLDENKLRDYLRWVEKEKVSDWLGLPYEEERQDANPKLVSVAKVIEEFENPKIETEFLRTEDGTVYGWAVNGKIFLTPEVMKPNTPAHEYTHLLAAMVERNDPRLWSRIVEVMKESPTWNEVLLDEAYRDIHNNDSRMASEVLSRLSGEENYRRAIELAEREIKAADGIIEKAKKIALWGRIKQALADFWASVKGVFGFKDKAPWTEFVDMALGDLYTGVNPNAVGSPLERMFIGEDQIFIEESLGVSASEGKESLPKMEAGKEKSVSLPNNLNSSKHDDTWEKASVRNGARAYIEEVARILQTRLGRAEKPTEEVERIIQNFNRDKTIFAHTPLQRKTLALLRTLTNKEIQEEVLPALEILLNKAKNDEQKREFGEMIQVVKRFINRNERAAVIEELSGAKLGFNYCSRDYPCSNTVCYYSKEKQCEVVAEVRKSSTSD